MFKKFISNAVAVIAGHVIDTHGTHRRDFPKPKTKKERAKAKRTAKQKIKNELSAAT